MNCSRNDVVLLPILALAAFDLIAFVVGCGSKSQSASQSTGCICGVTNWVRFSPDVGGFSILMPLQPKGSFVTNESKAGPLIVSLYGAETSGTEAFCVGHNLLPPNTDLSNKGTLFDAALDGALKVHGKTPAGRLISETEINLNGYLGREWRIEKFQGKAAITMRCYLVGHDLYQTTCVMHKKRFCKKHSSEFLDSFALVEK